MSAALQIPAPMSLEEFLTWDAPDGAHWQLIDGEPRAMAPASPLHSSIHNEFGAILRNHLAERGGQCRAYGTPGIMLGIRSDRNYRIPDIGVTCTPLTPGEPTLPDPILLVETLSPGNPAETWIDVWAYTTITSVQEALVIRTDAAGVHILRRKADGTWPNMPISIETGEVTLDSIGLTVKLNAIYAGTWLAL
jgi:Uma2 family endonuclease